MYIALYVPAMITIMMMMMMMKVVVSVDISCPGEGVVVPR